MTSSKQFDYRYLRSTPTVTTNCTEYCGIQNGLVGWYDGDTLTPGTQTTTWTDESISQNNVTGSVQTVTDPTTGKTATKFVDGVGSLSSTAKLNVNDLTIITVATETPLPDGSNYKYLDEVLIGDPNYVNAGFQGESVRSFNEYSFPTLSTTWPDQLEGNNTPAYSTLQVNAVTYSSTSGTNPQNGLTNFYLNGQNVGSGYDANSGPVTAGLHIGGYNWINQNGAAFTAAWNGEIAEVLIYNRALTTTELQTVQSFLASKYNLPPIVYPTPTPTPTQTPTPTPPPPTPTPTPNPTYSPSPTPLPVTSGLTAWFDAGFGITTTNGTVTQWNDLSPLQFNLFQTPGNGPVPGTDAVSGKPVVAFNGQTISNSATVSGISDCTIITVSSQENSAASFLASVGNSSGFSRAFGIWGTNPVFTTQYSSFSQTSGDIYLNGQIESSAGQAFQAQVLP